MMCTAPPPLPPSFFLGIGVGEVELQTKFSKMGGLTGPQLLEGADFFHGGLQFLDRKMN